MQSKPITILVSQDSFLFHREIKNIQDKTVDSTTIDFNFDKFSAKEDSVEKILDACSQLPMMGASRLVLVQESEAFKKDALEKWLSYFSDPSPTTKLVLTATKIDKRLKLWQMANKKGWIQELKPPFPNQLPPWIQREAKSIGLDISPQAAQAMADSIGVLLAAQVSALEKLQLYIMPRKKIELTDVEAVVGEFLSKTIFDFTDKVGARNFKEATRLLDQIAKKGEPYVRILFMMARHFRLLLLSQEGMRKRWSDRELAQKLGVHPFFVKDYLRQAKTISSGSLKQIYQGLLRTDRALKSSPLDSRHVMDRFLMEACL